MLRTSTLRQSSKLLKRSIATQAAPKAEITELSNGIIVASKPNKASSTNSVGIVVGSGSTSENPYNNGVSNLLTNIFKNRQNSVDAGKLGFTLESAVGRDFQSYVVNSAPGQVSKALDFVQSKISAPISDEVFATTQSKVLKSVEKFEEQDHANRVLEHLHATAFQNTPLSLPTRGTPETLEGLVKSDVESFATQNFLSANAVVVGSGNLEHEELVKAVEKQLSLQTGSKPYPKAQSSFLGSEIRLRDDTLPKAWISIAAEGEPITSPDFYTAKLAAEIFGSHDTFEPASRLQGIKLIDEVEDYHICDSFNHFSLSYQDSGLWGFSTVTSNITSIDDLVHFTLKQWNRLTTSVTETEVARAKALLKLKLASEATDNASIATHLGAATLANFHDFGYNEVFAKIDAITVKNVKEWAGKRLWDQDIAICGTGQIEGLLDYSRIRNDMSMMRW